MDFFTAILHFFTPNSIHTVQRVCRTPAFYPHTLGRMNFSVKQSVKKKKLYYVENSLLSQNIFAFYQVKELFNLTFLLNSDVKKNIEFVHVL